MKLIYSEIAKNQIKKLPPQIKRGIREILESLKEDSYIGKALQRDLFGFRSLAFKRYRIIYKVLLEKKQILIYSIEHRQDIYDNLSKMIKRIRERN